MYLQALGAGEILCDPKAHLWAPVLGVFGHVGLHSRLYVQLRGARRRCCRLYYHEHAHDQNHRYHHRGLLLLKVQLVVCEAFSNLLVCLPFIFPLLFTSLYLLRGVLHVYRSSTKAQVPHYIEMVLPVCPSTHSRRGGRQVGERRYVRCLLRVLLPCSGE